MRRPFEAQMLQAERLAAVGTLAAGVAHEMNNPLAYITANVDALEEELASLSDIIPSPRGVEIQEILADTRDGLNRLRRIVRDLKVFASNDDERRVPVDLGTAVTTACNLAAGELRQRARICVDVDHVPPVWGAEGRLAQVLVNLLVNAAQAFGARPREENLISITASHKPGRVQVQVTDNGPGMPPEVSRKVFDPFYTTKDVGQGTGLGLAICHGIVTGLEGRIHVTSEEGVGTSFTMELPAVD